MAMKTSDVQNEIVSRNQAVECLKKALRPHGLRIDLQQVFVKNGRVYELLGLYFDRADEAGSAKFLYKAKPEFSELVKEKKVLEGFGLLPCPEHEPALGEDSPAPAEVHCCGKCHKPTETGAHCAP